VTRGKADSLINGVVLYGSCAREDTDSASDKDVCVFASKECRTTEEQVRQCASDLPSGTLSITTYSQTQLEAMLSYGSLFLWHLKLEGRILYGNSFIIGNFLMLRPFSKHHDEIAYHREIFSDLTESISRRYLPNEFDLAVLSTIARNTCMVLAHKGGVCAFGRNDSYNAASYVYSDLPLSRQTYILLTQWKLVYERGAGLEMRLPSHELFREIAKEIGSLLSYAEIKTT